MIDDLYSARILSLAANLPFSGRLDFSGPVLGWPGTGEQVAKLCGSKAVVDVLLHADGQTIRDFAQDIKACALGQAAAAVLGESVIGSTVTEIRAARDAMTAMLKFGGEGPTGRFEGLRILKVVADYPARHASTMVAIEATLNAVADAWEDYELPCVLGMEQPADDKRTRNAG